MNARVRRVLGYVSAIVILLTGWQLLSMALGSPALPAPAGALATFVQLIPELWPHFLTSLARILVAMTVGMLIAVPLGLAIGRSRRADAVCAPLLFLTYPVPKVAFLPVLLVLFGLGNLSKIVLIGLIVFFQILMTSRDAAKAVPASSILSVRSLGASRMDIARHVVFPAALPEIFSALRIGIGTAIAVLFFAESVAGTDGLGWFVIDAWGMIGYPRMFAGILAMALMGVLLYEALDAVEAYTTRWRRAGL